MWRSAENRRGWRRRAIFFGGSVCGVFFYGGRRIDFVEIRRKRRWRRESGVFFPFCIAAFVLVEGCCSPAAPSAFITVIIIVIVIVSIAVVITSAISVLSPL